MKLNTNKNQLYKWLILIVSVLSITKFTYASETTETLPYKNLVEQNKTWWYMNAIVRRIDFDTYYFGIKIEGDTIIDNVKWSKCWLIDVEKNKILKCPISLIREEDKKIHRYPHDEWLGDAIEEYLNNNDNDNKYFRDLVSSWVFPNSRAFRDANLGMHNYTFEDYLSSPENYPLYDFYTEKKQQAWPWSIMTPKISDYIWTGIFEVPRLILDEDGRQFQAHRMLRYYEERNIEPTEEQIKSEEEDEFLIIEGVGVHNLRTFYGSSTFLWPADIRLDLACCKFIPELLLVTLNDDSEIFFRSYDGRDFTLDYAVHKDEIIETSENENAIYDLMGNEINNPVTGGIYISKGQKIVWK